MRFDLLFESIHAGFSCGQLFGNKATGAIPGPAKTVINVAATKVLFIHDSEKPPTPKHWTDRASTNKRHMLILGL